MQYRGLWQLGVVCAVAFSSNSALASQPITPELEPSFGGSQCAGSSGYSEDFGGRQTYLWRPQWLTSIAARASADVNYRAALIKAGDRAILQPLYSVANKSRLVPGASKHDYASIGPYWWPDTTKRDGLPYVRRDGQVNPERDGPEFDKSRLRALARDLKALALAHYVTGDAAYANRAAQLIRTWFLDPDTRMAPNMNFAQGIPGRVDGRGEGIIEAADLSTVIEAAGMIWGSNALENSDKAGLRQWYAEFVAWMVTSKNGENEMLKRNNHGVFYDFYLSHFALFAGMDGVTTSVVAAFPEYRLATQMDAQGRFIEELKRTRSWHYSVYVVEGAAKLATIAECSGQNLWGAQLPDGRGLATARTFLQRYSGNLPAWPFPDIDKEAGRLDRMQAKYASLELLFDRTASTIQDVELP